MTFIFRYEWPSSSAASGFHLPVLWVDGMANYLDGGQCERRTLMSTGGFHLLLRMTFIFRYEWPSSSATSGFHLHVLWVDGMATYFGGGQCERRPPRCLQVAFIFRYA